MSGHLVMNNMGLLQVILFTIAGATARAIWYETSKLTLGQYLKKTTLPVAVSVGVLMVGRNSFLQINDKYELIGYSLLFGSFGPELMDKVKNIIRDFVIGSNQKK